jgi:hypothetical protein
VVSPEEAKRSADIVASVLVQSKLKSLENHSLGEVQTWRNEDEAIVRELRSLLTSRSPLSGDHASGYFAAHVVAAAVLEAVSGNAEISEIFESMLFLLKEMHNANPSWGPLYVVHRGNLLPHVTFSKIG